MDDFPTEWEWPASATSRANGRVSARCLDWPRCNLPVEPSLRLRRSPFPGNGIPSPETTGTLLEGHEPSTSTKILPSLTSYFARSSASAGSVAGVVGIEGGVVSGVINLESSGVGASDWRPRHEELYQEV